MSSSYTKAGVNIDAGNLFVDLIRPAVEKTKRPEVLAGLGGFGAFFELASGHYKNPVLVSSTDGVGTKLKLAIDCDRYDTIGQDLVAMCVNDIACSGASPLFFLDYFATGKLLIEKHVTIVRGIARACEVVGCSLIGGETAEMPDCYHDKDFDLAGFAVGVVEKNALIDGKKIIPGDVIMGLYSSGFHSNGYSLIRKILRERKIHLTPSLGDSLLRPTLLYSPLIADLVSSCDIHGIAHITGGGFWDNIPRILPSETQALINIRAWTWPDFMKTVAQWGNIPTTEMLRVFNCGIGMIIVAPPEAAAAISQAATRREMRTSRIGTIVRRETNAPPIAFEGMNA